VNKLVFKYLNAARLYHSSGKNASKGKAQRVPKTGAEGTQPSPGERAQTLKRGELSTPTNTPRVGPKMPANSKPPRVGKRESRGAQALGKGFAPTMEALRALVPLRLGSAVCGQA